MKEKKRKNDDLFCWDLFFISVVYFKIERAAKMEMIKKVRRKKNQVRNLRANEDVFMLLRLYVIWGDVVVNLVEYINNILYK